MAVTVMSTFCSSFLFVYVLPLESQNWTRFTYRLTPGERHAYFRSPIEDGLCKIWPEPLSYTYTGSACIPRVWMDIVCTDATCWKGSITIAAFIGNDLGQWWMVVLLMELWNLKSEILADVFVLCNNNAFSDYDKFYDVRSYIGRIQLKLKGS